MIRSFFKIWFSRRRSIYIKIARKYHSTPWKIYYLAHGGMCKSDKDAKLLHILLEEGIISQIYPW